jgi:hypothetical protein
LALQLLQPFHYPLWRRCPNHAWEKQGGVVTKTDVNMARSSSQLGYKLKQTLQTLRTYQRTV